MGQLHGDEKWARFFVFGCWRTDSIETLNTKRDSAGTFPRHKADSDSQGCDRCLREMS